MRFYQRAWLSIVRGRSKTLILFLILFVMGNVMAGSLAIRQTGEKVAKEIKQKLGTTVAIRPTDEVDPNFVGKDPFDKPLPVRLNLSEETLSQLSTHPGVEVFDMGHQYPFVYYRGTNTNLQVYRIDDVYVIYTDDLYGRGIMSERFFDLESKKITITEGRNMTQTEIDSGAAVGLIPEFLAKYNMINVGDKIPFRHQIGDKRNHQYATYVGESYEIEVVGFFKLNTDEIYNESGDLKEEYYYIYVPEKYVEERYLMDKQMYVDAQYYEDPSDHWHQAFYPKVILKSDEYLDEYKQFAIGLINQQNVDVITSNDAYESVAAPVLIISLIAEYILILAFGATILSVSLVILLFLRDRVYEVGVYGALGEKKIFSVMQIVMEILIITFASASIAMFTGQVLAQQLSNSIVLKQLEMVDEAKLIKVDQSEAALISASEVARAYKIEMSAEYALFLYGILMTTGLLSSIVPMVLIVSVKPKKILM
ncbi:MAG: ABC transporter permease [Erysipelotrichaceae bacterium]|nr:ABC transporter permease [Erysipelotrichaceae bacterium]MDP3305192.1 ABC transporter permease [Erysipelotrichaceae bacterium]